MDSMNMTDTSNTTSMDSGSSDSMSMMMMKTFLHFTPGDTLIFDTIVPTSAGAIFGACLILLLISVGDRYLRAVCRGVEHGFVQRSKRLTTVYHFSASADHNGDSASDPKIPASEVSTAAPTRFILSHELSRGALAGLQSTVHYFLMLVVMTFNASFIISVILGVVVGEVAFGRLHR
ncbi:Ctr copper transporter [Mycena capillaripes]|nr:Ctr copper transporter [Mycena capillaripes]